LPQRSRSSSREIDALVTVGLAVAVFVVVLAAYVAFRTPAQERSVVLSLTEAGVFAAGALTIFGIFRTVLPESTTFQADPVLGLGLVILLIVIWLLTEAGGFLPSLRRDRSRGGGGSGGGGRGRRAGRSRAGRRSSDRPAPELAPGHRRRRRRGDLRRDALRPVAERRRR
jgi:MFS family permease